MYAKIFSSLYQGTLRGQAHAILVFTNLLAHCDQDGFVDLHFRAIADETGITVDEVRSAISYLEAPDPESRSPEEGGRRIVNIDEHRAWGWRVVNYVKYRDTRSEDDRREKNRQKVAAHRAKQRSEPAKDVTVTVTECNPVTVTVTECNRLLPNVTDVAHTDTDTDTDTEVDSLKTSMSARPTHDPTKLSRADEFLAEWNEAVAFSPARFMTPKRVQALSLRMKSERWASEYLAALAKIKQSPFLRGENKSGWKIDIDFFLRPDSVTKILEDKYDTSTATKPTYSRPETMEEKAAKTLKSMFDIHQENLQCEKLQAIG
jgi:hypothetical protein